MTDAHCDSLKSARFLSPRLHDVVRDSVALTGFVLALAQISAAQAQTPAQAPAAMTKVCARRADNAKLIAEDRDKGVSRQDELLKARGVVAAMPVERQLYAQAELTTFIDHLYGRYAKMSPKEAHDKYLAFCEQQAASGAAEVR